jgi:hypothetical protein
MSEGGTKPDQIKQEMHPKEIFSKQYVLDPEKMAVPIFIRFCLFYF